MKKIVKEPRLLPNVMEAIVNLKERNGSTQEQIIDQITRTLRTHGNRAINLKVQVRKALEHGLHSGLIKQRSGKFRLGLGKRNYEIFKRLTRAYLPTYESKRRGSRSKRRRRPKRGRRRSKSRRRRYSTDEEDETEGNTDTDRSVTKSPEPQDKSRRRRKSRRKGRRSRRRYRRRGADSDDVDSDRSSPENNQRRSSQPEEKRSDQDKLNYQSKSGTSQMQQDQNQQQNPQDEEDDCGNPDCLCNIKQEEGPSRNSTRDNFFHQSYLN